MFALMCWSSDSMMKISQIFGCKYYWELFQFIFWMLWKWTQNLTKSLEKICCNIEIYWIQIPCPNIGAPLHLWYYFYALKHGYYAKKWSSWMIAIFPDLSLLFHLCSLLWNNLREFIPGLILPIAISFAEKFVSYVWNSKFLIVKVKLFLALLIRNISQLETTDLSVLIFLSSPPPFSTKH